MEVATVLSPLRIAEQIVGIPVRRARGQGSLPGQSTTRIPGKRISERMLKDALSYTVPVSQKTVNSIDLSGEEDANSHEPGCLPQSIPHVVGLFEFSDS